MDFTESKSDPLVLVCTKTEDFVEKSKTENLLVCEKLGIKNPQSGFPLLPVALSVAAHAPKDILVEQTCNIGLLPYLSQLPSSETGGTGGTGAVSSEVVREIGLSRGIAYDVVNIGRRMDIKESTFLPGKSVEIREIAVVMAPTSSTSPALSPDDEEKLGGERGAASPPVEKVLSTVLHIPIVSDIPWKKLSILLSKKYARYKDKVIQQLTVPGKTFDPEVAAILLNPANREILETFLTLREEVNDINNGAYIEAFIHGLLSYISVNDLAPLFPRLYGVGRGQEVGCILNDPQISPMWKEYAFLQYAESYYNDILVMHSQLDLELLMADLFQIVFGLDYAQRTVGFIHHNLDIRKAIGYVKMDPCTLLQYKWHDTYYHIPTGGKMIKICGLEHASVTINDVQHTAEKIDRKNENNNSFNTDLVRLGATLKKVIQEKQLKTVAKHPDIENAFNRMINKWVNCGNPLAERHSGVGSSSHKLALGAPGFSSKEVAMQEYRLKCLQAEDENGMCTWRKFGDVPSHTECTNAIPYRQQEFFKMFRVDKSKINADGLIYVL